MTTNAPDWTDTDEGESISETRPAPTPANDRHTDPQIETLVLPKPDTLMTPPQAPRATAPAQSEPDNFPSDLREAYKMLSQLDRQFRLVPNNARPTAEELAGHERLLRLRAYISERQDTRPKVPFDFTAAARQRGVAIATGESGRNQRAELLKAFIAAPDGEPVIPSATLPEVLLDFAIGDGLPLLRKSKLALAQYELSHIEAFMYHSPRRRSEERKSAALSRPDAETTKKLVDEATIAANPHFGDLRAVKCAELTEQYDSIVRPAEIELLNAAISHLEGLKSAATESVAALSSEIGVELSLKDVCKKFDGHISTLAQIKGRLTDPPAIAARTDVGGNVPHPAQSPTASFWGLAIP